MLDLTELGEAVALLDALPLDGRIEVKAQLLRDAGHRHVAASAAGYLGASDRLEAPTRLTGAVSTAWERAVMSGRSSLSTKRMRAEHHAEIIRPSEKSPRAYRSCAKTRHHEANRRWGLCRNIGMINDETSDAVH